VLLGSLVVAWATLAAGGSVTAGSSALGAPVPAQVPAAATSDSDSDGDGLDDVFEEAWGVSSATTADSDGDGLIDAAEDDDGDGLSALAEQRAGNDPGGADSDADGVADGDEDSDGDGIGDAAQQDRRRLPAALRPTTKMAWWDRPGNYDDRCHNDAVDPALHPCDFAASASDVSVVLFGDSHALQWLPALVHAGQLEGWNVVALTKAACPPAAVEFGRKEPGAGASCIEWRERALEWLSEEPPDVLLLAGAGRVYKLVDSDGERLLDDAALAEWQRGLAETLAALPESSSAVVLADTPLMRLNPVSCLEAGPGDMSACVTSRSAALGGGLDDVERSAAEAAGLAFASLSDLVCPYDPCPVVIGDVLLWRNADHITATFAEQLAPAMRRLVLDALAGPDGAPATDGDAVTGQRQRLSAGLAGARSEA
jgi:hypothetical protein